MNVQHETFVREYVRTCDKTGSYLKAFPNAKETSAKTLANRLLQNHPELQNEIDERLLKLRREAETETKEQMKEEILTLHRAKVLLTQTAEGTRTSEKMWRTARGYETQDIKPNHAQMLSAIRTFAQMEGWYVRSAGAGSERAEKTEEEKIKDLWNSKEKVTFKVNIDGIPMDEWGKLHRGETDAYFDKEDGTAKYWPVDDCMHIDRVMDIQKRREKRKDAEREARMTPELIREEKLAIKEWETRPVDEEGYEVCNKVIERIRNDYIETKKPELLTALQAVQKMCGLRFLHHRHRYEAENTAGWEFHPFNSKLIRKKINSKRQLSTTSIVPVIARNELREAVSRSAASNTAISRNEDMAGDNISRDCLPAGEAGFVVPPRPSERLSRAGNDESGGNDGDEVKEVQIDEIRNKSLPLGEVGGAVDLTGYKYIRDLAKEALETYLKDQNTRTFRAHKQIMKLAENYQSPPEIRAQVEQETGWEYHPQNTRYARGRRSG